MRLLTLIGTLLAVLLALTACGGEQTASTGELLPLAENRPTFVFFFTDP